MKYTAPKGKVLAELHKVEPKDRRIVLPDRVEMEKSQEETRVLVIHDNAGLGLNVGDRLYTDQARGVTIGDRILISLVPEQILFIEPA